jgi:RimJ/RimL family protein N-acetyltransferase
MAQMPILRTDRLVLRPFVLRDAADVQRLAGDPAIAATTAAIPHPYKDGMAEAWIGTHQETFDTDGGLVLAVTLKENGQLIGAISLLSLDRPSRRAELGYWIGQPYWNQGYATEAARAIIAFGFEGMDLKRVFARYMKRNPASGRVMEKAGMRYEGTLRQHVIKDGQLEDLGLYAVLRQEHTEG